MTIKSALDILAYPHTSQMRIEQAKGFIEAIDRVRPLVEAIKLAQPQTGKRTQILKDGTEEIECLIIPKFLLLSLLSISCFPLLNLLWLAGHGFFFFAL